MCELSIPWLFTVPSKNGCHRVFHRLYPLPYAQPASGNPGLGILGLGIVLVCLLWSFQHRLIVKEESLLVIPDLGVQIATKYADGRETTQFLDRAKIKEVLINEGITMQRVIFYMAFIVVGQDEMVVPFNNLKPRLDVLAEIYRGTRALIFGEAGGDVPVAEDSEGEDRVNSTMREHKTP
ncbi:unnamed protein product [Discosporangium mesarthrocarpum]